MKEKIKVVSDEKPEMTKQESKLALENELNVKKKELEQNLKILNGWTDEKQGIIYHNCDKIKEFNEKVKEMKEIEFKKDQPEPANRRFLYESDGRWRQLRRELFIIPEIEKAKLAIERITKQKEQILKENPLIQEEINKIEKKLGKKITKFEEKTA